MFLSIVESNGLCTDTQEPLNDGLRCDFLAAINKLLTILADLRHTLRYVFSIVECSGPAQSHRRFNS